MKQKKFRHEAHMFKTPCHIEISFNQHCLALGPLFAELLRITKSLSFLNIFRHYFQAVMKSFYQNKYLIESSAAVWSSLAPFWSGLNYICKVNI